MGTYVKTEEHKRNLSIARKNSSYRHSAETRRKISLAGKGVIRTEEYRRNISLRQLGKKFTQERKDNISKALKGKPAWNKGKTGLYKHSEESKKRIGLSLKGRPVWNKGIKLPPFSEEHRKKMSEANKRKVANGTHHLWKGGVSEKNRAKRANIMTTFEYSIWRRAVFQRDNYTCVICGIKFIKRVTGKVMLHADHIKSFKVIIEENEIQSTKEAISCKELWDINNGRTLCVPCHRKTDNYGGKTK